ncbi:hypothetical protein [Ralstonia phage RP12]|uniref:Uncharacterized protein n=1 Tax=Ralstonia phage RP12 TaxID=1923889 RepID=A0A1L7N160_9CAUD|nr:hypothetical protein FDH28_gp050 [Ralstonia phage RP12]BAW19024.1 hypothetical protein [Ralstonia phage RP12]
MYNFMVPSTAFKELIKEAKAKTNEVFEPDNPEKMRLLINHHFNVGFARLHAEGRLIAAENQEKNTMQESVTYYGGLAMNYTDDGYTTFNTAHIPLSPSDKMH